MLASYSMITRVGLDDAETISMHRLFHSVIRDGSGDVQLREPGIEAPEFMGAMACKWADRPQRAPRRFPSGVPRAGYTPVS
ncbi:hypothetical protein GCM10018952_75090 [Streptosporangium vulgare]